MNEDLKEKLYGVCRELKMTPMRTIIILIQLFSDGKINSKEVISRYNSYYEGIREERLKNLRDNRVSGNVAHKINQSIKPIIHKETKLDDGSTAVFEYPNKIKWKPMPKSFVKKVRKIKVAFENALGK